MNNDIFSNDLFQSPLKGLRICLVGDFSIPTITLNKQLRGLGVTTIDRVVRESKSDSTTLPAKETTNLFVVGNNAPTDCLDRYELNCHDGYKARRITEEQLYSIMRGELSIDIPHPIVKKIDLNYSYYEWKAPAYSLIHRTSPFVYDMNSVQSPVYGLELFVPEMEGINYFALGQIIGNLGGFSNNWNTADADMVMLSDTTIEHLKKGIKDPVILKIEQEYNASSSKQFKSCFTSVSDFVKWVKYRLEQCPDPSTQNLMDRLFTN